ncbi:hypothetical protein BY457_12613 [Marinilabilia salmonicolor]|nr:hypothetical protein BY457_12613 [Marinilabilia salmonicolor]
MNFEVLNSQKSMNKIHREFHSANDLNKFCTNEINGGWKVLVFHVQKYHTLIPIKASFSLRLFISTMRLKRYESDSCSALE